MSDPEIEAMSAVASSLAGLDEDAQGRVLRWAAERFGMTIQAGGRRSSPDRVGDASAHTTDQSVGTDATAMTPAFEHFAELFAAARPRSNADKALVAAYWVQVVQGQSQWASRLLSTELKHLGHSLSNITMALSANMNRKPQLVIQLKKSGSTAQATKTYKLTNEGVAQVKAMISASPN